MNRNVVVTKCHNKYKYVLLNDKCLKHSMKRIHSEDHRIGICEESIEFHCLVLMTKYISKTMNVVD